MGIRSGAEEPRSAVVETLGALEIRRYGPRLAAETESPGGELDSRHAGLARLVRYLSGENISGGRIAMTAPVAQEAAARAAAMDAPVLLDPAGDGHWRIRLFMPGSYTLASLPRPTDPAVHIVAVPPQTLGVLRTSGPSDPGTTTGARRELLQLLEGSGWGPTGETVSWFYDPPWTPSFLRRNEAAVLVERPVPHTPPG